MAIGKPLTPEQIAIIAEEYEKTGSYSAAARALGVDESTARKALKRRSNPTRSDLYARAEENGIRRARKDLKARSELINKILDPQHDPLSLGVEPKDIASLVRAQADLARTQLLIAERRERLRTQRLTRDKMRAEIKLIDARMKGTLPPDHHVVTTVDLEDPDAVAKRLAELHARSTGAHDSSGTAGGADTDGSGES